MIVAGTGAGEHGLILSYEAVTNQRATMSKAWVIAPDTDSEYILVPADVDVELWNDNTVTGDGDWRYPICSYWSPRRGWIRWSA